MNRFADLHPSPFLSLPGASLALGIRRMAIEAAAGGSAAGPQRPLRSAAQELPRRVRGGGEVEGRPADAPNEVPDWWFSVGFP